MEFGDIAAVSGKSGLFKIVNPTRNGVILETFEEPKKKMIVGMSAKVSVLSDISIYTTDGEGSVPLQDVLHKVHKEFEGDTGLKGSTDNEELKSFLKFILPNYDESRVYVSDIKKLVNWYHIIAEVAPEVLVEADANQEKKEDE